ncbi:MAG: hypothetical protein ACE5F1_05320 [Planctomycetota bacterium]
MEIEPNHPLESVNRSEPVHGVPQVLPSGIRKFQDFLEALERLSVEGAHEGDGHGSPSPLDEFGKAVDLADHLHQRAMDMKQRLEESFRKAMDRE